MNNSSAPIRAPSPLFQPRQRRRNANLSFDALASIDFISLFGQGATASAGAATFEPGEEPSAPSETPAESADQTAAPASVSEAELSESNDLIGWAYESPFYSLNEAAAWLGVSLATIKRLLARGVLPHVRVGSRRKIPFSALRAYVVCARAGCSMPPPNSPINSTASGD